MDKSSASDAGRNASHDALASLLGVKAQLRLVPHQENTPKAHIVLKRDYPKGQDESEESSARVARFSFIAGKKFTIAKGAQLYFSVASPTDRDGKTLLCDEKTFLLEADILDESEGTKEEEVESPQVERSHMKMRGDIEGLPPKMRKSFARKTTYESFIEKEPPASLGFPGYPLSAPTPRVYSTAAVQTDLPPPTTSTLLEHATTPRVSLSIVEHPNKSPVQLPSPVSADHAREPISESLVPLEGEEMDDFSREERSLSPMDLGSASCSPAGTPAFKDHPLPAESLPEELLPEDPLPEEPLPEEFLSKEHSPMVCDTPLTSRATTPSPEAPASSTRSTTPVVSEKSTPIVEPSGPIPPELRPGPTPPQSVSPQPQNINHVTDPPIEEPLKDMKVAPKRPEPPQELSIKKELVLDSEKPLAEPTSVTSSGWPWPSRERLLEAEGVPLGPRAMGLGTFRSSSRSSGTLSARAQEKAPAVVSSQASLPSPISMKIPNSSTQSRTSSPPPDPKALVYISSGSSSNPLGIRPSSSVHSIQKSVPKGPRSLVGPSSTATAPAKKPVVVGAKWSAARNPASGSSMSNGGLSASSSSSSLTPVPSSPILPAPPAPAPLSQILRYESPSPPPPPESDPPPPLPPQPGVAKWKRISTIVEKPLENVAKKPEMAAKTISKVDGDTIDRVATIDGTAQKNADAGKLSGRAYMLATGHHLTPYGWMKKSSDVPIDKVAVNGNVLGQKGASTSTPASTSTTPSSASSASLKRPHDLATKTPVVAEAQASKQAKSSPPPLPIATSSSSLSSLSSSKSTTGTTSTSSAKPQPAPPSVLSIVKTAPKPFTHPLPPKPQLSQAAGSSYRPPVKRDRSPEPPEVKRSLPRTDWPSTSPSAEYQLQTNERHVNLCVQKIMFNSDGSHVALVCADRTLRIWENKQPAAEVARLSHNSGIASACWLYGSVGVMTLTVDGVISTWTRNGKEWQYAKLLTISDVSFLENPANASLVYAKDRIAVTIPSGVKVWLLINGTWQPQRDIVRSGVTAIRFVQEGSALVGGCRDGVLWYCEVPNGTLRVHAFLSMKPIASIDVHPTGVYLLIGQEGGKSHLVTLKPGENKGTVERMYTSEKLQSLNQKGFPAVFATKGQAVLYGTVNGCGLVWDRKKGMIVYGLKHPEGDPIQAAATFDGRPGMEGLMITGTKQGRLFWWPQPVAAAPSHSSASSNPDESQRKRQKLGS